MCEQPCQSDGKLASTVDWQCYFIQQSRRAIIAIWSQSYSIVLSLSASAPYAKHQIIFKWRQSIIYRSKLPLPPRPALNRQHSARRRPLLRELLLVRSSINKTTICEIIDRRNKRALHIPGTDNMYACSTTHYSPATWLWLALIFALCTVLCRRCRCRRFHRFVSL